MGTPTRASLSYFHLAQDNLPEYGLPWVPVNTNPELAAYSNGMPPVDQSNFYGLKARDYENTDTDIGTLQVDHDFSGTTTLRNLTRYGMTDRDSVITAPRFVSVNTSTTLNRQLQSRDMEDDILANQTNLTTRFQTGQVEHAVVTGLEFARETSENFARIGPVAPLADLFDSGRPCALCRADRPQRRLDRRHGGLAAAYAFDTVSFGPQWEVTGGLRWDRFDVDYTSVAVTGVADRVRAHRRRWSAGAAALVYKPQGQRQHLRRLRHRLQSVGRRAGADARPPRTSIPKKTRSLEVGTKWDVFRERLSLMAAFFRTEKTNARTPGVNPGDPPTVLAGEQRVNGIELGASGRIGERWTLLAGYSSM